MKNVMLTPGMAVLAFALPAFALSACGTVQRADVTDDSTAAAAAADLTTSQVYELISVATGQAVDLTGSSTTDGTPIQEWPYWGGTNQQWRLAEGSSTNAKGLVNVFSGKALDVPNGSTQQGTLLQQWDWWDGPMQNWTFNQESDGSYEIVNVASGLCLDVINGSATQGTRIQEWGCWGGTMQRWQLVPVGAAPSPSPTVTALSFGEPGSDPFDLHDYGAELLNNKATLEAAINASGASESERALIVAMAMMETNDMEPSQRDSSKDGTPSANISILNLNADMVQQMGYTGTDNGASLNDPSKLPFVVGLLLNGGIRTWGVQRTLNFQRGGSTAFNDGVSYGAADYRNAIATIYAQIAADITLLNDSRRVEVTLNHV